ncbi:MAG: helix-turn-helix domain-containing protein [Lentisphaerae bacterium]|nr:helix-turn-helix domain-containing protein [Lentisphaerota bacterium]OQC12816.1 MAG: HTH-type transcriptional regulator YiaJ [Lentisphaerae bacterium ADurb.Bin082]HQL87528.1 helix-turn-helix domain-containing protein [Lentisphaeria bacterium]
MNDGRLPIKPPVEALRRGLALLELLSEHGSLPLAELAQKMDLKRTTAHNLLKTLVMCGYAANDGDGVYRLGGKLRRLAAAQLLNRISHGQAQGVLSILSVLTEQIGETLVLAGLVNGRRKVLARTNPQQAVLVSAAFLEQESLPIWHTETGRILAAFAPADALPEIISANGMPDQGWRRIVDMDELTAELATIRTHGVVLQVRGEVFAAAVPVIREDGWLLAALGVHMPVFRRRLPSDDSLLELLRQGASRLADAMVQEASASLPQQNTQSKDTGVRHAQPQQSDFTSRPHL